MKQQITFTLDLEDHRPDNTPPKRYLEVTERILEFLDLHNIKATIFTVGKLAEESPKLIKNIHQSGHEIAHHSYDHTPLTKQTPEQFKDATKRAKHILEDIIGVPIVGYRAPIFSLTRDTLWAVNILKDLGFSYSSSTLPAKNPLYGFSDLPSTPFQWSNSLIEIPVPIGQIGPVLFPYLGGFYFRYTPFPLVRHQMNKAPKNALLWTYCHPYDFDAEEKNWRIKGASTPVSLLLWFNRKNTFRKLERLAQDFSFSEPFKDHRFSNSLTVIDPATL